MSQENIKQSLRMQAKDCLLESDCQQKIRKTHQLYDELCMQLLLIDENLVDDSPCIAGCPEKPELVPAYKLPRRGVAGTNGHAALMHSFAHIEFNAINIAWDAVYRFPHMPVQYYLDWALIAREEAEHFCLINNYLKSIDHEYGSFKAHDDLWEMVQKTSDDVLLRMAMVPRVLEARGLDVTPAIIEKFRHHGFQQAVDILVIIYHDEIGHVKIGNYWFNYLCKQRGLDPVNTFMSLIREYAADKIRKPFNEVARSEAGFTPFELELLNSWQPTKPR